MPADRCHQGIPADLRVEMGMHVDEPGCDQMAPSVDLAEGVAFDFANCRDPAFMNTHVARVGLAPRAVADFAAPYNHVVLHLGPF